MNFWRYAGRSNARGKRRPFILAKTGNKVILKKIEQLTMSILEDPYQGIGKPEALKHSLSGKWSRRITQEHRYVYEIADDTLFVISLKGHY